MSLSKNVTEPGIQMYNKNLFIEIKNYFTVNIGW